MLSTVFGLLISFILYCLFQIHQFQIHQLIFVMIIGVILCGLSFYGTIYVSVNYFVITSVVLSAQSFLLLILNKNYEYHAILNQIYFQLNHMY